MHLHRSFLIENGELRIIFRRHPERSVAESKDLRIWMRAEQDFGAKIPPRATLGRDDAGEGYGSE